MGRRLTDHVQGYEGDDITKTLLNQIIKEVASGKLCNGVNPRYAEYIIEAYPNRYLLVFREDGKIRGFAAIHLVRRIAYLDLICSSIRGAGKELLVAAELVMREKNMYKVRLFAIPQAELFYKKMDYLQSSDSCKRKPVIKRKGDNQDGYRYEKCLKQK